MLWLVVGSQQGPGLQALPDEAAHGGRPQERELRPGQRGQFRAWGLHKAGAGETGEGGGGVVSGEQSGVPGKGGQGTDPVGGDPSGCWCPLLITYQTW